MARITSKLQVTIPRVVADRYGLKPGMEIEFVAAGDAIRVLPPAGPGRIEVARGGAVSLEEKLRLFDAATARQRRRNARHARSGAATEIDRGWTREELYERGRSR